MKTGLSVLLSLGIGVIGLVVGGGVGFTTADRLVTPKATAAGMCLTVDTALRSGILTADRARQLGTDTAKANAGLAATVDNKTSVDGQGAACQQFLQGLKAK